MATSEIPPALQPSFPQLEWAEKKGYLGRLHPTRADRKVYGDKAKGLYLLKFAWFPIERQVMVKGTNAPDDSSLKDYWDRRQLAKARNLRGWAERVLTLRQKGRCPLCGESILEEEASLCSVASSEEVHRHRVEPGSEGGTYDLANVRRVHLFCHQQIHARMGKQGTEQPEA